MREREKEREKLYGGGREILKAMTLKLIILSQPFQINIIYHKNLILKWFHVSDFLFTYFLLFVIPALLRQPRIWLIRNCLKWDVVNIALYFGFTSYFNETEISWERRYINVSFTYLKWNTYLPTVSEHVFTFKIARV